MARNEYYDEPAYCTTEGPKCVAVHSLHGNILTYINTPYPVENAMLQGTNVVVTMEKQVHIYKRISPGINPVYQLYRVQSKNYK